jgi:hypothetical protein
VVEVVEIPSRQTEDACREVVEVVEIPYKTTEDACREVVETPYKTN